MYLGNSTIEMPLREGETAEQLIDRLRKEFPGVCFFVTNINGASGWRKSVMLDTKGETYFTIRYIARYLGVKCFSVPGRGVLFHE